MVVRCDHGTENTSLATVQIAFRLLHDDSLSGEKSFVYGPSKSNNIVSILSDRRYTVYVGMARVESHVIRVQNGFKLSQNG